MATTQSLTITVTLEADYERGVFVAHCLDFNLVATAKTQEEVRQRMLALMMAHLNYAAKNDLDPVCRAPEKYWDKIKSGYPLVPDTYVRF